MIEVPQHPNYMANKDRYGKPDALPCVVCGKGVSKPRWWVRLHLGGSHLVTEAEAETLPENEDMGAYPLGADCLRQHPELRLYAQVAAVGEAAQGGDEC